MNLLARKKNEYSREKDALQQALDKSYAQLRERARVEWQRYHAARDPSDACVRVRIGNDGLPTLAF